MTKTTTMNDDSKAIVVAASVLDRTALAMMAFATSVAQATAEGVLTDEQANLISERGLTNFHTLLQGKSIPGYMEFQQPDKDTNAELEPTTNEVLI